MEALIGWWLALWRLPNSNLLLPLLLVLLLLLRLLQRLRRDELENVWEARQLQSKPAHVADQGDRHSAALAGNSRAS